MLADLSGVDNDTRAWFMKRRAEIRARDLIDIAMRPTPWPPFGPFFYCCSGLVLPLLLHFAPYLMQSVMNILQTSIYGCKFRAKSMLVHLFLKSGMRKKCVAPLEPTPDAKGRAIISASARRCKRTLANILDV
jgi:hypothetical protein